MNWISAPIHVVTKAMAAIGAVIEFVMMFSLLPALMALRPKWQEWTKGETNLTLKIRAKLQKLGEKSPHRLVSRSSLLIYPLAIILIPFLVIDDNPESIFGSGHAINKSSEINYSLRGWKASMPLFFHTSDESKQREETPQIAHTTSRRESGFVVVAICIL